MESSLVHSNGRADQHLIEDADGVAKIARQYKDVA